MNLKSLIVLVILLDFSNQQREDAGSVKQELLGPHDGSEVYLFTHTNKAGNDLKLTNNCARIVGVEVPDRNGKMDNVVLGSYDLESILRGSFGGATIGRFTNRIANGKFTLDGVEYDLPVNNKPNTLHGGPRGWYAKVWNAEMINNKKRPAVRFSYVSPDMEEGFPGTINIEVVFTWTNKNEIIIEYTASTDKKSVINVTNHAYFNLHGAGNGNIFDHEMTLRASAFTPLNSTMIPTGEIRPVKGTPFDFTSAQTFGARIGETYEGSVFSGYDHNYVLDNKEKVDAVVYDPVSGRMLEMMTDQPAMQLYTGNGLMYKRQAETGDRQFRMRSGFCLESQHYPDSPNQPVFPSTVINPGKKFKSRTIYRFSVKK
jgi:aldose 1-epimerase